MVGRMTRQPGSPVLHRMAVLATAVLLLPALSVASCVTSEPPSQPPVGTPAAAAQDSPVPAPLLPSDSQGSSGSEMPQSTLVPVPLVIAPAVEDRGMTSAPPATRPVTPPGLESSLAQLFEAYHAGDRARLATFAGQPNIDLERGAVRVILEMDRSPEAHPAGPAPTEIVTTESGRQVTIEHAPPIAIRADLAAAIAATGATYETAYENWVQVLAPFAKFARAGGPAGRAHRPAALPCRPLIPMEEEDHDTPKRSSFLPVVVGLPAGRARADSVGRNCAGEPGAAGLIGRREVA